MIEFDGVCVIPLATLRTEKMGCLREGHEVVKMSRNVMPIQLMQI